MAGGSSMGSVDGLDVSGGFEVRTEWTGVPKAGEDEGIRLECAGGWSVRKRGAVRIRVALFEFSIARGNHCLVLGITSVWAWVKEAIMGSA